MKTRGFYIYFQIVFYRSELVRNLFKIIVITKLSVAKIKQFQ